VATSILELGSLLRQRHLSPVDLTRHCLAQIEKLNGELNAFITVTADSALAQAREAEAEIQKGQWRGPLHGIPLALKDLIDTAGVRTTAASGMFEHRIPEEDAEVVRRLKKAGAVLVGKQNLHEFAYGGSSLISYFGPVRNPWDPACIAGGSSGGSAASVAAGLCYAAIGTDTAGSVREPAALCGVVALKPTYGRVSCCGVIPLSRSFDHVGPIARTVSDAAVILQAIAGPDPEDPNCASNPVPDYLSSVLSADVLGALCGQKLSSKSSGRQKTPKAVTIGVPRKFFYDDLDAEVVAAVDQALTVLAKHTSNVVDIDLAIPTDRTLQSAESYAYHAEFVARSPEFYQPETLRRIRTGEAIRAEEVEQRRRELKQLRREISSVFHNVDFLVTPTTPIPGPAIAELTQNPELLRPRELLLLRNTRPVNVWGLPAISVPCGFTAAGLPIGLQIIGAHWAEARVLQLAAAYERETDWHTRQPQIRAEAAPDGRSIRSQQSEISNLRPSI